MHRTSDGRASRKILLGLSMVIFLAAGGADGELAGGIDWSGVERLARAVMDQATAWYRRTPPSDRVVWGGLVACAGLGLGVLAERSGRLRRKAIVPSDFVPKFVNRLRDGKLDRGKALDFCEVNPSPAARVALAAVRRWGRPVSDLERAVALAYRIEADRLRRNVGTLRRVAALSPLLGLLGTLVAAGRGLSGVGPAGAWGPAVASALSPFTAGVAIAIVALVAYDGLVGKIEALAGTLDRLGAETIDAIAMAATPEPRPASRAPHLRVELPDPRPSPADRDARFD